MHTNSTAATGQKLLDTVSVHFFIQHYEHDQQRHADINDTAYACFIVYFMQHRHTVIQHLYKFLLILFSTHFGIAIPLTVVNHVGWLVGV